MIERKIIRTDLEEREFDAEYNSYDLNHTQIDDIIDWLIATKAKGATHIDFGGSSWDGIVSEVTMQSIILKPETEEEYQKRLKTFVQQEQFEQEQRKRKEYQQFLALKAKFEK